MPGGGFSVSVADFGAKGDGTTDETAAVAAAIAAAAQSTTAKTVFFPPGKYVTTKPLTINAGNVRLVGVTGSLSQLLPQFAGGPALLIASPRKALDTTDALVPGPGRALALTPDNFFFASDVAALNFDGLTEFTAECFAVSEKDITDVNVLVGCSGVRTATEGTTTAFHLSVGAGNSVGCTFTNADGTTHNLFSAANVWTPGKVHHLAMVLHAGAVTVYFDGAAVVSFAGTGLRLHQQPHHEVVIGGGAPDFPMGGLIFSAPQLTALDSVRLSDVARYTSDFTGSVPAAKFDTVADPHTLLLVNFDNLDPNFVVATSKGSPVYLPLRFADRQQVPTGQIGGNAVRDLTFECGFGCSGIYAFDAIGALYQDVTIVGGVHGILLSDVLVSTIERVGVVDPQRLGIAVFGQGEEITVRQSGAQGGAYPMALQGAVGGAFTNLNLAPLAETRVSLLNKGNDVSIHAMQIDDENRAGGDADILAADFLSLTILGGLFDTATARPSLIVDGGPATAQSRVTMVGTSFFANATDPAARVVRVLNPRPGLVTLVGTVNFDNRPLTNEPSAVTVI